jgi:tetratricopeptide (TPR) repeat protein
MKGILSKTTLTVGIMLATTLTISIFSSCATTMANIFPFNYPVPDHLRKTYEETVEVPNASAENLFKKIRLYLIEHLEGSFIDSYIYSTTTRTLAMSFQSKVKTAFNEENNHISGYISNPYTMKIEVFINPEQYRVTGTLEYVYAKQKEIEQEIEKILPEVEQYWQSFTAGLKHAITEDITDEEFETLIQSGNIEFDKENFWPAKSIFLKAAMARPNNNEALYHYGISLGNIGINYAKRVQYISGKKGQYDSAIARFNMALYVLEFARQYPKTAEVISKFQQDKQQAEQLNN